MIASSQAFVADGAVTAVAFAVAMSHCATPCTGSARRRSRSASCSTPPAAPPSSPPTSTGRSRVQPRRRAAARVRRAEEVVGRPTPMPFHESREILPRARELGVAPGYAVVTQPLEQRRRAGHPRLDLPPQGRHPADRVVDRHRGARPRRRADRLPQRGPRRHRPTRGRAGAGLRPGQGARGHPADAGARPGQGRVRLGRQPRAAYPADQHRRLHRAARRRRHRRASAPPSCELVEQIDRNGERLLHLVEDLLTLARVEDGELPGRPGRRPTCATPCAPATARCCARRRASGGSRWLTLLPEEPAVSRATRRASSGWCSTWSATR